ncbi:MAG: FAD-dependent oxidoreductase [Acidobacteriota bacterium]|jgi:2,4-dienoyl-CoA reductase-like NADH-dependent reductase (Old Yellow Enzyme family)/thioredoxin reductase|nr:FAD-dependent oxidoreductase [Acidobacteriota bacterium]
MESRYKHVFEPLKIRNVVFKNRLEMAPPSPNLASRDGRVTPEFVDFFRPIARGGVAVIHVGNSVVDIREACDEERQLDLGGDGCILPLTRFVEMCHGYGALASLEINHNGKDSQFEKTGRAAYSASSFITASELQRARQTGRDPVPTIEMDAAKIRDTVEKYALAAQRCKRAGFKMCMVHGGHGNLISQFVSSLYNKRSDEYGGSLENRARFAIETLDRIRELCGEDFVIEFRISADEIHPVGMRFEETLKFIELIQDKIDILHVSAGLHGDLRYMRNWWQNYLMARMYNVHYAADIKKAFPGLPVCAVGSIMNIQQAEEIIAGGKADLVAMCRPILADPEMPRKYALGREDDHRPCLRCQYCGLRLIIPAVINCAVNPFLGNETEFPECRVKKADIRKRVAVVGGGPAGIQALLTLCERGHDVTLYERTDKLGGHAAAGSALPFKQDMRDYLSYLRRQAEKSPARIIFNVEATPELLLREGYDALIIAVGSDPVFPAVPGIQKSHVHWAPESDSGAVAVGEKTVIVGAGAVGVESAIGLRREGKDVRIIEMALDFAGLSKSAGGAVAMELTTLIEELKIPVEFGCRLEEVRDDKVVCFDMTSRRTVEFPADTVLTAAGMTSRSAVADSLRRCAPETEVFIVGDAAEVGTIASAVRSAFHAAAYI